MSSAATTSASASPSAATSGFVYPTHPTNLDATVDLFNKELKDTHLVYDYDVTNPDGSTEKWRYEL